MATDLIRARARHLRGSTRTALAFALVALAGASFAQTTVGVDARVAADARVQPEDEADARPDRFCLRETGSRIPVVRRLDTQRSRDRCLTSNGRVYTREDLDSTGRVDIADALRALDPSIR